MRRYGLIDWLCWGLVTLGAINWGLKGSTNRNLVERVTGGPSYWERAAYVLVGAAGLWSIFRFFQVGLNMPTVRERLETANGKIEHATRAA